jgi:hypothetical protein
MMASLTLVLTVAASLNAACPAGVAARRCKSAAVSAAAALPIPTAGPAKASWSGFIDSTAAITFSASLETGKSWEKAIFSGGGVVVFFAAAEPAAPAAEVAAANGSPVASKVPAP